MFSGIAAGGADLVGGILQSQAQQANAKEVMDFQRDMSNTAYQRATADMTKAGLNPLLAFSQGGASTPSGAMQNPPNITGGVVNSALAAKNLQAQIDLTNTQADTQRTTQELQKMQTAATAASAKSVLAELPVKQLEGGTAKNIDNLGKAIAGKIQAWINPGESPKNITGAIGGQRGPWDSNAMYK